MCNKFPERTNDMKTKILAFLLIFAMMLCCFGAGISAAYTILYGDATGDGMIDGKDLVRLKKYLAAYDYDSGTSDVVLGPDTGTVTPPVSSGNFDNYAAFTWADIVKVDENGMLYVNALIDASGVKKEIAINDYNKFKVGLAMYNWLKSNGYMTADPYWEGSTVPEIPRSALIDALRYANTVAGMNLLFDTVFAARVNADGTYSLIPFTPFVSDDDAVNIVDNVTKGMITLNYGINNMSYVTYVAADDKLIAAAGQFDTTNDTVYVFAGKDDIHIFKGVAPNGSTIDLSGDNTVLLHATNECVFVYDNTKVVADLYTGWSLTATPTDEKDYVFYAITNDTKAYISKNDGSSKSTLTATGLYNVLTGEKIDIVVTADHETVTGPIFNAINNKDSASGVSTACGKLLLFSASEKRFELSDAVYDEFEEYVTKLWAVYTTKYLDVKLGNLNSTYMLVINDENITVQSYRLTTFWGYDGSVETVDGVNVKRNFNDNNDPDNERAYLYIDANGNAYGYVFAPGMAK